MTGIDGYDWSVFGANPVPGDPDVVRGVSGSIRDLADSVAQQSSLVQSVGSDSASVWVGPAATKFRPLVGKLPGQLSKLTTSYGDAADALDVYWPKLRDAQNLAVQALARANAAKAAITAAQGQVSAAAARAATAAASYNQATLSAALAPAATPAAASEAQTGIQTLQAGYRSAQGQLSGANAALAAANAEMAAAVHLKDTAVTNALNASSAASTTLHQASVAGIQNPHHHWYDTVIDDIGSVASSTFHYVEHTVETDLKAAEPFLKDLSAGLGVVSAVLAVASLVLAPFGVGEVLEVVNEGVMGLKTADDGLLVAAGDKDAVAMVIEDGVAMATGGLGRVLEDGAAPLEAAGEVTEATEGTERAAQAAEAAKAGYSTAMDDAAIAGGRAQQAEQDAGLLRGMQSDALIQGDTVNSVEFGLQADAKLGEKATALADQQSALARADQATGRVSEAEQGVSESQAELANANVGDEVASQYASLASPTSATKSFLGANNLSKTLAYMKNPTEYRTTFAVSEGLTGSPTARFGQYYSHYLTKVFTLPGAAAKAGAVMKLVPLGVSSYEGVEGGDTLVRAATGAGGG